MGVQPIQLPDGFALQKMTRTQYIEAIEVAQEVLNINQRYSTSSFFLRKMRLKISLKHSIVLVHQQKVIGGYFFNEHNNIFHEFGLSKEKLKWAEQNIKHIKKEKRNLVLNLLRVLENYHGKGIEGVALFLKPEFRSQGLGKALIEYPYTHLNQHFSYIWGGQEKTLNNLFDWLKRRELLYDTGTCFYTIGSLQRSESD
jgi:GNAT superfamily N-acetyltransferase